MTDGGRKLRRWGDPAPLVEAICARLEAGERLGRVLAEPEMPSNPTFFSWLRRRPELAERYRRARGRGAALPAREGPGPGRPSAYDPELAAAVCEALAGAEGLDEVCARPGMPSQASVYRWLAREPAFAQAYARAREAQAHRLFDLAWEIARAATEKTARGDKLRIDTLRWQVGKLAPKRYGERPVEPEGEGLKIYVQKFFGDEPPWAESGS